MDFFLENIHLTINGSIGIVLVVVGLIILIFKAASLVTMYRHGKYDDDKFCKIIGSHIAVSGLILVLGGILMTVLYEHLMLVYLAVYIAFIAAIAKGIYYTYKYARI